MTLFKVPLAPVFLSPTLLPTRLLGSSYTKLYTDPPCRHETCPHAFANPLPLLDHLSPPSCLMNSSWVISPEKHLRVSPDKIIWAFPALGSHNTLRCSSYLTSPPPPVELLALCLSLLLGCGSLKGRGDVFLIFVACELGTVHLMAIVQ